MVLSLQYHSCDVENKRGKTLPSYENHQCEGKEWRKDDLCQCDRNMMSHKWGRKGCVVAWQCSVPLCVSVCLSVRTRLPLFQPPYLTPFR